MKKNAFFKKALTFISAAVMAGAVGLGAGVGVNAADGDTTASTGTTDVVLTKYQSTAKDDVAQTDVTPDKNQATVKGAGYTVYDVSSQYWAYVDDGTIPGKSGSVSEAAADISNGKVDGAEFTLDDTNKVGDEGITNDDGQTTFTLNNSENGKATVYEFVETTTPDNFTKSSNFVISLPAATAEDGKAYVYPKDQISGTYQIKFQKVDANNQDTPLKDAQFYIKNGDQYAELLKDAKLGKDADGNKIDNLSSFTTDVQNVVWGAKADATSFTSDADGMFGFTANPETKTNGVLSGLSKDTAYSVEEIKEPKGYQNDAKLLDADNAKAAKTIDAAYKVTDTPEGILPHTGGAGIIAIVVAGLAIVTVGVIAYNRRRANA